MSDFQPLLIEIGTEELPARFVECGIAEQHMVSAAATGAPCGDSSCTSFFFAM